MFPMTKRKRAPSFEAKNINVFITFLVWLLLTTGCALLLFAYFGMLALQLDHGGGSETC